VDWGNFHLFLGAFVEETFLLQMIIRRSFWRVYLFLFGDKRMGLSFGRLDYW
jgi:hypothetical protein